MEKAQKKGIFESKLLISGEKLRTEAVKRKGIKGMIWEMEKRDRVLEKFDEGLWSGLVDYMTVNRDGKIEVRLGSGAERIVFLTEKTSKDYQHIA